MQVTVLLEEQFDKLSKLMNRNSNKLTFLLFLLHYAIDTMSHFIYDVYI